MANFALNLYYYNIKYKFVVCILPHFPSHCVPLCRACFHCCMLLGATDYAPFALPLACLSVWLYLLCLSCLRLQRCLHLSHSLSLFLCPAFGSCRRVCVQFTRPASSGKQTWQAASCRRRHCDQLPDNFPASCSLSFFFPPSLSLSLFLTRCVWVDGKCWKHVNC